MTYYIDLPSTSFRKHDTDYHMPSSVLANITEQAKASPLITRFTNAGMLLFTEGEIGPGMVAPVIAPDRKTRKAKTFPMKWGLCSTQKEGGMLETVDLSMIESPARKCVIPCSWLLINGKIVHSAGSHETWVAGVYQIAGNLPVFALITRKGNPAVLQAGDIPAWLKGEDVRFVRDFMVEGDIGLARKRL